MVFKDCFADVLTLSVSFWRQGREHFGGKSGQYWDTHKSINAVSVFSPLSLFFLSDRLNSKHHLLKSPPKLDPRGLGWPLPPDPARRTVQKNRSLDVSQLDVTRGSDDLSRLPARRIITCVQHRQNKSGGTTAGEGGRTLTAHKSAGEVRECSVFAAI